MKKLLAGLALAFAAAILLQKRWTGGQGKVLPRPNGGENRRTTGPREDVRGMQDRWPEPTNRTEMSAASSAADTGDRRPQQSPARAPKSGEQILNSATRQQLLSVYGIGPVLADRIIQNRPYAAAYDVVEKGIIPESIFVQLRKQLLDQAQPSGPL
jgi:DNA uptake protein ComE-like DNA-binding protein